MKYQCEEMLENYFLLGSKDILDAVETYLKILLLSQSMTHTRADNAVRKIYR